MPVREDNYAYIIVDDLADDGKRRAVFVDPFDVHAVSARARDLNVDEVTGCITTHHHFDHAGGNEEYAQTYPNTPIWGPSEKIPCRTNAIEGGDSFLLPGSSIRATVYATPCHTRDSVCVLLEDESVRAPALGPHRAVLTGDTLFIAGCGRFFEGGAADMLQAIKALCNIPPDSLVCCGHEYTASNAKFAAEVLPRRAGVAALLRDLRGRRNNGVTTNLYTLAEEARHNPFILAAQADPEVLAAVKALSPLEAIQKLREAKNAGSLQAVL